MKKLVHGKDQDRKFQASGNQYGHQPHQIPRIQSNQQSKIRQASGQGIYERKIQV